MRDKGENMAKEEEFTNYFGAVLDRVRNRDRRGYKLWQQRWNIRGNGMMENIIIIAVSFILALEYCLFVRGDKNG